jgi:hypothetical protein
MGATPLDVGVFPGKAIGADIELCFDWEKGGICGRVLMPLHPFVLWVLGWYFPICLMNFL